MKILNSRPHQHCSHRLSSHYLNHLTPRSSVVDISTGDDDAGMNDMENNDGVSNGGGDNKVVALFLCIQNFVEDLIY